MKKFLRDFLDFIETMNKNHIGVYAAQASFFMILSIFPLIMLALTIIGFTDLPKTLLVTVATKITPGALNNLISQIINELSESASGTIASITAIAAIWSASKGVYSIIMGIRRIFDTDNKSNFVVNRLLSMLYVVIIVIVLVFSLVILVFGNSIFNTLLKHFSLISDFTVIILAVRSLVSVILLTVMFVAIYKTSRNSEYKIKDYIPGAMFAAAGWMLFSYFFSIYIDNFSNFSYMYGSLTALILMMLWLYFCMYILFIGAQIVTWLK